MRHFNLQLKNRKLKWNKRIRKILMDIPYLEFYLKHNISPVTQTIRNKKSFFIQRQYLYQSLGIAPILLRNKSILEFGPGNGVNAIFNYAFSPARYVLVDGNLLAIENIRKNFSTHFQNLDSLEVVHCLFNEYDHNPLFDLVICENFIANLDDPARMVVAFSQNVIPGGILFITCKDRKSLLSETLRSFIGLLLTRDIKDLRKKADFLTNYFCSHLSSLAHVGRSFNDWVLDNILQERYSIYAPLFSISQAVHELNGSFIFYHSSPVFHTEMRWYKSVNSDIALENMSKIIVNSYYKNMLNFLDYRINLPPHSIELGKSILRSAEKIRELCQKNHSNSENKSLLSLTVELNYLAELISPWANDTAITIKAYATIFESGNFEQINTNPYLIHWWGRGTQYLSFVKN